MQFLMPFIKSGRKQLGNLIAQQPETEVRDANIFDDVSVDESSNQTVNLEIVHEQSVSQPTLNTSLNNIG